MRPSRAPKSPKEASLPVVSPRKGNGFELVIGIIYVPSFETAGSASPSTPPLWAGSSLPYLFVPGLLGEREGSLDFPREGEKWTPGFPPPGRNEERIPSEERRDVENLPF